MAAVPTCDRGRRAARSRDVGVGGRGQPAHAAAPQEDPQEKLEAAAAQSEAAGCRAGRYGGAGAGGLAVPEPLSAAAYGSSTSSLSVPRPGLAGPPGGGRGGEGGGGPRGGGRERDRGG